jgi:hypothetical protein
MTQTEEFDVWQDDVPVIELGVSQEFDLWQDDVPVVKPLVETTPQTNRRRSYIF